MIHREAAQNMGAVLKIRPLLQHAFVLRPLPAYPPMSMQTQEAKSGRPGRRIFALQQQSILLLVARIALRTQPALWWARTSQAEPQPSRRRRRCWTLAQVPGCEGSGLSASSQQIAVITRRDGRFSPPLCSSSQGIQRAEGGCQLAEALAFSHGTVPSRSQSKARDCGVLQFASEGYLASSIRGHARTGLSVFP